MIRQMQTKNSQFSSAILVIWQCIDWSSCND